jgi:hypothetical protein
MKKLLQRIFAAIKLAWNRANDEVKEHAVACVNIVEAIKNFNDSDAADFLEFVASTATKGLSTPVTNKVRQFIKEEFPMILIELKIIKSVADLTDDNEKLKAILAELKLTSTKGIIFKGVAGYSLVLLADGKFDFNDAVDLTRYYLKLMQEEQNGAIAA